MSTNEDKTGSRVELLRWKPYPVESGPLSLTTLAARLLPRWTHAYRIAKACEGFSLKYHERAQAQARQLHPHANYAEIVAETARQLDARKTKIDFRRAHILRSKILPYLRSALASEHFEFRGLTKDGTDGIIPPRLARVAVINFDDGIISVPSPEGAIAWSGVTAELISRRPIAKPSLAKSPLPSAPKWDKWKHANKVTLEQFVALWANVDPDKSWSSEYKLWLKSNDYEDRMFIANSDLDGLGASNLVMSRYWDEPIYVTLKRGATWAVSKKEWTAPPDFYELAGMTISGRSAPQKSGRADPRDWTAPVASKIELRSAVEAAVGKLFGASFIAHMSREQVSGEANALRSKQSRTRRFEVVRYLLRRALRNGRLRAWVHGEASPLLVGFWRLKESVFAFWDTPEGRSGTPMYILERDEFDLWLDALISGERRPLFAAKETLEPTEAPDEEKSKEQEFISWMTAEHDKRGRYPPAHREKNGEDGWREWGARNKVPRGTVQKWVIDAKLANPIGAPKKAKRNLAEQ